MASNVIGAGKKTSVMITKQKAGSVGGHRMHGKSAMNEDETERSRDGRASGGGKKTSVTVTKKKAGFLGRHCRKGRSAMTRMRLRG